MRGGDVVLDRARHAHRVEPLAVELVQDAQAAAADDRDQCVDVFRLQLLQQLVGHVDFFDHVVFVHLADVERVDPGRLAEQARGGRVQALDQLRAEGQQPAVGVALRVQQTVEAVPDADHLPPQLARGQGRAHDHGVDPRHVAGAHHDRDAPLGTACPICLMHRSVLCPWLCDPLSPSWLEAGCDDRHEKTGTACRTARRTGSVDVTRTTAACVR